MFLVIFDKAPTKPEQYDNLEFATKRLGVLGGGVIYRYPSSDHAMAAKCIINPEWVGDAKLYPNPVEGKLVCNVDGYTLVENTVFPNIA